MGSFWGKNTEKKCGSPHLCSFLCTEYFIPQIGEEKPLWVAGGVTAVINRELHWGSKVRQLPGKDSGSKVRTWQDHIWFCYVWLLAHGPLQTSNDDWSRRAGGLSGLLWYQQVSTLVLMLWSCCPCSVTVIAYQREAEIWDLVLNPLWCIISQYQTKRNGEGSIIKQRGSWKIWAGLYISWHSAGPFNAHIVFQEQSGSRHKFGFESMFQHITKADFLPSDS